MENLAFSIHEMDVTESLSPYHLSYDTASLYLELLCEVLPSTFWSMRPMVTWWTSKDHSKGEILQVSEGVNTLTSTQKFFGHTCNFPVGRTFIPCNMCHRNKYPYIFFYLCKGGGICAMEEG